MGAEGYAMGAAGFALQVNVNKVARLVTKLDIFTLTSVLMQQCGCMPMPATALSFSTRYSSNNLRHICTRKLLQALRSTTPSRQQKHQQHWQ